MSQGETEQQAEPAFLCIVFNDLLKEYAKPDDAAALLKSYGGVRYLLPHDCPPHLFGLVGMGIAVTRHDWEQWMSDDRTLFYIDEHGNVLRDGHIVAD